ncbi:hypothetical protein BZL29_5473 [Mycobacterium kansasii]|uniref:Uncharacterized protein n=1 Tax=Mycobacterium kansasii TaxID=1768 RepID=A0A1V3WVY2_MYCKA|nr:hypothetical protein BZL29_5473 [Mycobacterium kansasii]
MVSGQPQTVRWRTAMVAVPPAGMVIAKSWRVAAGRATRGFGSRWCGRRRRARHHRRDWWFG